VNTAARMESNGESNKIQVSETTAELIKKAGKGYVFLKKNHCCYRLSGRMNVFLMSLNFHGVS
jgi:class 3 adenylate cyclase